MDNYYFDNPSVNAAASGSWSSSSMETKKGGSAAGKKSKKAVKLSTDPQSIAARERRQRIRERFRILQSLVPGGSKMDTASMLEEAVHYVHFLKNQIRFHHSLVILADCNDGVPRRSDNDLFQPCTCCTDYTDFVAKAEEVDRLGFNDDVSADQMAFELPSLLLPEPCFHGQDNHVFR